MVRGRPGESGSGCPNRWRQPQRIPHDIVATSSLSDAGKCGGSPRKRALVTAAVKSAVLNASPLIVLARAGYLDLVPKLVSSVVVPRAVATEVAASPAEDPAARFLTQPSWLSVVDLAPP